jgi:hypothetical protein
MCRGILTARADQEAFNLCLVDSQLAALAPMAAITPLAQLEVALLQKRIKFARVAPRGLARGAALVDQPLPKASVQA